jgi:hypothetical protein
VLKVKRTNTILPAMLWIGGFLLFSISVSGQNNTSIQQIKELYKNQKFEEIYENLNNRVPEIPQKKIFKALAFYKLSKDHEDIKKTKDRYLKTMELIRSAQNTIVPEDKTETIILKELEKLQTDIFIKAKKYYKNGRKNKADTYFDALHKTFNNSNRLFKNHYGFDDTYFLEVLESKSRMNQEHKKHYKKEIQKLLNKYYYNNPKFREWDNPKYRLANTAKKENYLNEDEKMVFYFLNLVRMNPELFLETFVRARLRVRYHGEIKISIPLYDTLTLENNYNKKLSRREFYNMPVHNIYQNELPGKTENKFIEKKAYKTSETTTRYRYNINYSGLYNYLNTHKPELLVLKNLSKFRFSDQGKPILIMKRYDYKFSFYNRTYMEETQNSFYYQSLFKKLRRMKSLSIIYPDYKLFKLAECWAVEAGKRGLKGHDRKKCPYGYNAEACDYGNKNGFDVVLNLLIDKAVPNLGHRKILLGDYTKMGVAIRPHKLDFNYNAVLDFGL